MTWGAVVGHLLQSEVNKKAERASEEREGGGGTRTETKGAYCSSRGGPGAIGIHWVILGVRWLSSWR